MKNVEMTCWVSDELREKFKKKFPNCFSRFVRNCMIKAVSDKKFFDEIFFGNNDNDKDVR